MKQSSKTIVGMDLGKRNSEVYVVTPRGTTRRERLKTNREELVAFLKKFRSRVTVVMEACSVSPWVSHLVSELGHEAVVANPRNVHAIAKSDHKNDRNDAELLARVARLDRTLLKPIAHRDLKAHVDLMLLKSRHTLVQLRTKTINTIRGLASTMGVELSKSSSRSFAAQAELMIPQELKPALLPLVRTVDDLNKQIARYDDAIVELGEQYRPVRNLSEQVPGVGPITAAAFVLTIDNPNRFRKSRTVGAYLGLTPRQRQSGDQDPQLKITKAGNVFLRHLLVLSAQRLLRKKTPDCDLKAFGLAIAARGGKNAKKRAVVAVARKLAVMLHHLWRTGEVYQPLRRKPTPHPPTRQAG
jgi:transposase